MNCLSRQVSVLFERAFVSTDCGGEATQILFGVFKERLGVRLKTAFTRHFEVAANVGDNRVRIVQALVNAGEKKVYIAISLSRIEEY